MSTSLDIARPVLGPARIGQGTAVEQSRAVAEVHAMVVVAQQMPRDIDRAVREMKRSCSRKALAEKAFYRYRRGGGQISGESIVLAKELARCWGNIDYGIAELRRDDHAGESEMMAFAWDLETNTRPRTTFIVPHVRTGSSARLTDVRDVYENNANMGARRMREMILNLMPPWFVEDAKALCYATLAADDSDGATLAERAAKAVERFGKIGVRPEQLTQKLGAPQASWSAADLAQLTVIFRSIERGETTREEEFGPSPSSSPSAADLTAQADATPPKARNARKAATRESEPPPPAMAQPGQVGMIVSRLEALGIPEADRDARLRVTSRLAERAELIGTTKELTQDEAAKVIRRLDPLREPTDLAALLDSLAAGEEGTGDGE